MSAILTPDNAPRDMAGLMGLARAIRFRLALNLSLVAAGSDQAKAFVAATPEQQSTELLNALMQRDAGGAAPAAAPAPMLPQGQVLVPQPMTAPPPMTAATTAPPPMTSAPAPMTRAPATQSDPTNAGAAGKAVGDTAAMLKALAALDAKLDAKVKELKGELDTCSGAGELEELSDVVKGLARMTRANTILLLEIAENALSMDKVTIGSMVLAISDSGELDEILAKAAAVEGKD